MTIIVGAGLTGLTLARRLVVLNQSVLVIEKSRGVGGRLATRRGERAVFDHGAQYLKLKDPHPWHDRWLKSGVYQLWFERDDSKHFASRSGMTALAKDLAKDLPLLLNERVIELKESGREVLLESGTTHPAMKVVLTAPLPQALEILDRSMISYPADLKAIRYAKALVGLIELDGTVDFDFKNFPEGSAIHSITNNQSKGLGTSTGLTVVMSPQFSEKHFDLSDETALDLILSEIKKLNLPARRDGDTQLKRWRYSHPLTTATQPFAQINPHIVLAGDAFGGGSIAGAIRSGVAVADHLAP